MSRFYAEIKGNRGGASRMGTPDSGMWSHTRGWDLGAEVIMDTTPEDNDVLLVYITSGSKGSKAKQLLCRVEEGKPVEIFATRKYTVHKS